MKKIGIVVLSGICIMMTACGGAAKKETSQIVSVSAVEKKEATPEPTKEATPEPTKETTPEPTKEVTPEPTIEVTPEATEEPTPAPVASDSVFDPKDVSDATIESIETYGDYLIMYGMIVKDYMEHYEQVLQGTVLYDEDSFREMKEEMDREIQEQEKEYGAMKDMLLVGKDTFVELLKDYRDTLNEMVDSYEELLGAF